MIRNYAYARVDRVVDGDTLAVVVDLGFNISTNIRVRIAEINAPEKPTPEGKIAWSELVALCNGAEVELECHGHDPYGRWIAKVKRKSDDVDLGQEMLRLGMAVAYPKPA